MEVGTTFSVKDRCQILLLLSSEFKRINTSIPPESNKKLWFSDDFTEE